MDDKKYVNKMVLDGEELLFSGGGVILYYL